MDYTLFFLTFVSPVKFEFPDAFYSSAVVVILFVLLLIGTSKLANEYIITFIVLFIYLRREENTVNFRGETQRYISDICVLYRIMRVCCMLRLTEIPAGLFFGAQLA